MNSKPILIKKRYVALIIAFAVIIGIISIPTPTFENKYSTVIEDKNKLVLGAVIASDGQWRFPPTDTIPYKFKKSIIAFEDKNFLWHSGIDLTAIGRAVVQNYKARKIKSGASTITMQLIRLSRKGKSRNYFEKIIEAIFAIKLEFVWTKEDILKQYVAHAPFGGNVVGLSAASWRYFGRDASKLSWAETALLAVLPNHPAMIHLARNRELLEKKRNRLLLKLYKTGEIDKITYQLALQEILPSEPQPMPQLAPHLLQRAIQDGKKGTIVATTINIDLQKKAQNALQRYHSFLRANSIHNGAILILDIETGKVVSYVGNTESPNAEHENDVDMISAPRSYGSLLKPILYANMLEEGILMPDMLVADIPTNINGYAPQNFSKSFEGTTSAAKVLSHSLNVPSVRMLQQLGTPKFLFTLQQLHLDHIDKNADHYGLSIILGGAEATMWELGSLYANMSRILTDKPILNYSYDIGDTLKIQKGNQNYPFSKASLWCTAEAIAESNRPGANGNWEYFYSSQKIAWKTGTSYGFRDAWSIGYTKKYMVAVWLGNANGEGRAGLTGIGTAAPLMFTIFNLLDNAVWFQKPSSEMALTKVCIKSGHKATKLCPEVADRYIPKPCLHTNVCNYHVQILLDKTGKFQVNTDCEKVKDMQKLIRFVLPPIQEWYYKSKDPTYQVLPPYKKDCKKIIFKRKVMEIIFPRKGSKVFIPVELSGQKSKIVLHLAHRHPETMVYWHLDNQYLGETHKFHQMECFAEPGKHIISAIDMNGEVETVGFEVLEK